MDLSLTGMSSDEDAPQSGQLELKQEIPEVREVRALKVEYDPRLDLPRSLDPEGDGAIPQELGGEPVVDIIAVQGLASTYERTWTKHVDTAHACMWLRDLLPADLPKCRVLTYEYDSKWLNDPTQVTLRDCAKGLIRSVLKDRTHIGSNGLCSRMKRRPIIFIGHSFGGLVIKQAMVLAGAAKDHEPHYDDFKCFNTSIYGVMFLATPHGGSSFAALGVFQARIKSFFGYQTYPEQLRALQTDSTIAALPELREDFDQLRKSPNLSALELFCFYETKPMPPLGLVVHPFSACIDGAECAPLIANHRDMNKFCRDKNYEMVLEQLAAMVHDAPDVIKRRYAEPLYDHIYSNQNLQDLRVWLSPMILDGKLERLSDARYQGTCEWIYNHGACHDWEQWPSFSNVLWIHGKPGSGKSVTSAYYYEKLRAKLRERASGYQLQCSGFSEGDPCEKKVVDSHVWSLVYFSFEGQKRDQALTAFTTIIHQLLHQHRQNLDFVNFAVKWRAASEDLSAQTASELLEKLLRKLPLTFIVLDGIDECDDRDSLLTKLQPIAQLKSVKLLFFSRVETMVQEELLENFSAVSVDIAEHNGQDISLYIQHQVADLISLRPHLLEKEKWMVARLEEGSQAMFQWVKLKIDNLNEYGIQERDVEKIFNDFPEDLNGAYAQTFDRIARAPPFVRKRAKLALQWLVCAMRPLTLRELRLIIELAEEHENEEEKAKDEQKVSNSQRPTDELAIYLKCAAMVKDISDDELKRYFARLLGPLAQITPARAIAGTTSQVEERSEQALASQQFFNVIQLCHHSLRQVLVSQQGAPLPDSEFIAAMTRFSFLEDDAHEMATITCMRIMCSSSNFLQFVSMYYDDTVDDPPMVRYAFEYWSHHLRAAPLPFRSSSPDLLSQGEKLFRVVADTTLCTLGALAQAFTNIDPKRAEDMRFIICVRDAQSSLKPATVALSTALVGLNQSTREFRNANGQLAAVYAHAKKTGKTFAPNGLSSRSTSPTTIPNLPKQNSADSSIPIQAHNIIERHSDLLSPLKTSMSKFEEAARMIRLVNMGLCLDPVRTWLYLEMGKASISPIPLLAHASHIIEVFSSSTIFPLLEGDCVNVRHQYYYEPEHPLYGPMTCVRYELEMRQSDYLTETFYQEHIIKHLSMHYWERMTLLVGLSLLPAAGSSGSPITMLSWVWVNNVLQANVDTEEWRGSSPFLIFRALGPRPKGRAPAHPWMEVFHFVLGAACMIWSKLLQVMFSQMDGFVNAVILVSYAQLKMVEGSMRKHAKELYNSPLRFSILGAVLYGLRWKYQCQRLGVFRGENLLNDFYGLYQDPFNFRQSSFKWRSLLLHLIIAFCLGVLKGLADEETGMEAQPHEEKWRKYLRIFRREVGRPFAMFYCFREIELVLFIRLYKVLDAIMISVSVVQYLSHPRPELITEVAKVLGQVMSQTFGWQWVLIITPIWICMIFFPRWSNAIFSAILRILYWPSRPFVFLGKLILRPIWAAIQRGWSAFILKGRGRYLLLFTFVVIFLPLFILSRYIEDPINLAAAAQSAGAALYLVQAVTSHNVHNIKKIEAAAMRKEKTHQAAITFHEAPTTRPEQAFKPPVAQAYVPPTAEQTLREAREVQEKLIQFRQRLAEAAGAKAREVIRPLPPKPVKELAPPPRAGETLALTAAATGSEAVEDLRNGFAIGFEGTRRRAKAHVGAKRSGVVIEEALVEEEAW